MTAQAPQVQISILAILKANLPEGILKSLETSTSRSLGSIRLFFVTAPICSLMEEETSSEMSNLESSRISLLRFKSLKGLMSSIATGRPLQSKSTLTPSPSTTVWQNAKSCVDWRLRTSEERS